MKRKVHKKTNLKEQIFRIKNNFFKEIESDLESNSKFSIFEMIIIIFISILFGIIIGYMISYSRNSNYNLKDDSKLAEIISTYNNIIDNYYDDVSEDELANSAINGMIESLNDPYSSFLDEESTAEFTESINGFFIGIGVTVIFENDYNIIIDVVKSGPASKAGLKVDDKIIKVDGKDVKGIYGVELSKLIRGEDGTEVEIEVQRDDKTKTIKVKRSMIEIDSVTSNVIESNNKIVGYLNISLFASNTYQQFSNHLSRLEKKNIDALIIDVRNNPGGYLSQTKDILSLFFDKKTVLYRTEEHNKQEKIYSNSKETRDYPVILLINGGSASASEVLASCFKENYDNVILVGVKTYGKGTVQKSQSLSSGASIKYTIQKWFTSMGNSIEGIGIAPDYEVEQEDNYYTNPNYNTDTQLQYALNKIK